MIEVRCFDSFVAAEFLREEVNALNRATERPDPFSTFEFFENFLAHDEFAIAGSHLWFLAAFAAKRLVGYLVLRQVTQSRFGIRSSTLRFLVTRDTDRPHLVATAEFATQVSEAFYAYIVGRRYEWDLLEFHQQDERSALFPPPNAVDLKGYRRREWPSMENRLIDIVWRTFPDYAEALSQKARSNAGRQLRNLLAAGKVERLSSSHPDTTPILLEMYRGIEPHSWKPHANASIGRHPKRIDYFAGLLDSRQPMRITIDILLLDGTPIAGLITGAFMRGLYALHIVYDDRFSRLSPGSTMLLMGMRQAIAGGYLFFNLLSGFGYYKARWLAQPTPTKVAQIYRMSSVLFWQRVVGDCKRRLFSQSQHEPSLQFNPARREVDERIGELNEHGANRSALPDTLKRNSELLAAARKAQADVLSGDELAAWLSFQPHIDSNKILEAR